MSRKYYKKRQHSPTVTAKRRAERERIADDKNRAQKRMTPIARTLLLSDLVFLAIISLLEKMGTIDATVSMFSSILGLVLVIVALWFQFGSNRRGDGSGPKL